ncbi:MAG: hypothetical protein D6732_07995 [Methanobacteriota archaeon]|nr:MAG: hypothetical protein D6732_07995 [Euryarchaeota archaeon]
MTCCAGQFHLSPTELRYFNEAEKKEISGREPGINESILPRIHSRHVCPSRIQTRLLKDWDSYILISLLPKRILNKIDEVKSLVNNKGE